MATTPSQLAEHLSVAGYVHDPALLQAFRAVPRHLFLPGVPLGVAYSDDVVATKWAADGRSISSSSQPAIMAIMLEQLGLRPGHRVLEIGAGTGYNAALMAHVVGRSGAVVSMDIDQDLVEDARDHLSTAGTDRVTVITADGALGWPAGAPYDRVILTVGSRDVAPSWVTQLAEGGRLVLPLALPGTQQSVAFAADGGELRSVSIHCCGFMPLRGTLAGPDRTRQLTPDVSLELDDDRPVDAAALAGALREPAEPMPTEAKVASSDGWGGLALWLAFRLDGLGQLAGHPAEVPSTAPPTVLVGRSAFAALLRAEDGTVGVQGFGAGSAVLVDRLAGEIAAWAAQDGPGAGQLQVSGWFGDERQPAERLVLRRGHVRLALAGVGNPA